MLQRMSDQHKIKFTEGEGSPEPAKQSEAKPEKTIEQVMEEQKAKKLNNKDNGLMTSHHISSAVTGEITDKGGPTKYIKSETSNTLWDSDKTARLSQEIDNKTKTIQEKEQIATNKREAEQKRMADMVEKLSGTDQTKGSSVSPQGYYAGSNYKNPVNNMSIFDTKDFARVADKTEGEKVSEDVQNRKGQKDDSWRGGGKSLSSKDLIAGYFDQLTKKPE
ncbi:MAG: hypothetical protein ACTSSP_00890 [Candidatus Asgardarchaeia archaeon]